MSKVLLAKWEVVNATTYMKGCCQVRDGECLVEAWWQRPGMCLESLLMVYIVWSNGQHFMSSECDDVLTFIWYW